MGKKDLNEFLKAMVDFLDEIEKEEPFAEMEEENNESI